MFNLLAQLLSTLHDSFDSARLHIINFITRARRVVGVRGARLQVNLKRIKAHIVSSWIGPRSK